jgi:hypothetical protein
MSATRAATITGSRHGYTEVLSIGRVQTPTLALIVAPDLEIEAFVAIDRYGVTARVAHAHGEFDATWKPVEGGVALDPEGRVLESLANRCPGQSVAAGSGQPAGSVPKPSCRENSSATRGVSRDWGDGDGSDVTGRVVAGWGIVNGVGFAVGRNGDRLITSWVQACTVDFTIVFSIGAATTCGTGVIRCFES